MAKRLTEKQIAAIAILATPKRGGLTYEQVAEQVGVSRQTLHEWRRDDQFNDELKREIVRKTIDDLAEVMGSFKEHVVKDGNAALARVMLQAHGMLTEKHEVESNSSQGVDIDAIRERMKAQIAKMRGES